MKNYSKFSERFFETFIYTLLAMAIVGLIRNIWWHHPVAYSILLHEDSYNEYFTAFNFGFAGLILTVLSFRNCSRLQKWIWRILGITFLLIFGEEISWGQRIFYFGTPEWLKEANIQEEVTIHNLEVLNPIHLVLHQSLAYVILTWVIISILGAILQPLIKPRYGKIYQQINLILIPIRLVPLFFLIPYFWIFAHIIRVDEIIEMLLGLAVAAYALDSFVNYGKIKFRSTLFKTSIVIGILFSILLFSVSFTYLHSTRSIHHKDIRKNFLEVSVEYYQLSNMDEQSQIIRNYIDTTFKTE